MPRSPERRWGLVRADRRHWRLVGKYPTLKPEIAPPRFHNAVAR